MELSPVYAAVDTERDRFIADLRRLVQQPSISSHNSGVRECGELLIGMMRDLGIQARFLETPGHPVVFGELPAGQPSAPTLLVYSHYDTQPVDPVDQWQHPPFAATIVGDRIIGRGTTDAKGNVMASLKAVDAYRQAGVPLPVNLKFIFDGEEESGSPSLPALVEQNKVLLAADATMGLDGGFDASGRPRVQMGSSGLIMFRLSCTTASGDVHSARARIVESAVWRLVWALGTMKGPDDRILIKGFYDDVVPPTAAERVMLEGMGWDDAKQMQALGVERFIQGVSGVAALERMLYQPTININGFNAGHLGEGVRTVLPGTATVSLDLRLVANQEPEKIQQLLEAHLKENGFNDITVASGHIVEPSAAPLDSTIVRAVISAANSLYGGAAVKPRGEASGRSSGWLGGKLGIPGACTNVGPPAWNGHAPNEFITLGHYLNGIKYVATIWANFAAELNR